MTHPLTEEEYRALDVVAREFEELAKAVREKSGLWGGHINSALNDVADCIEGRASRIRGRLCEYADETARKEQDIRWQMFGESRHRDLED